ncbi:MAG: thiamine phosphate synthase [Kiritimatiellia bacterium]
MEDFGFYLVMTNPKVGYDRCAEAAVKAGVKMLQLRMKGVPRADVVAVARRIRALTAGTGTCFVVNDDPSIAAEVGADAVHVGQDDLPVAEVRRRYPSIRLVGLSTHNLDQARAAAAAEGPARPDYVGVGPVYATPTKEIPDPTLGPARAGEMVAAVPFPAVAIGGINADTLPPVKAAGARNFAVVRPVCASDDPYAAILALQRAWNEAGGFSRRVQ